VPEEIKLIRKQRVLGSGTVGLYDITKQKAALKVRGPSLTSTFQ